MKVPLLPGVEMCEAVAQLNPAQSYLKRLGQLPMSLGSRQEAAFEQSIYETAEGVIPDLHDKNHFITPNHSVTAVMNINELLQCVQVRWGWSPVWSMGTRPPLTHLPLEIVMRSKVFERVRTSGRALVAVDGWFDAVPDLHVANRNRYAYKRARSSEPVFLAALAQVSAVPSGCDGLVLITQGGGGTAGPLQLLAFDAKNAVEWLDPQLDWHRARELVTQNAVDDQAFETVAVSQRVAVKSR